MAKFVHISDLHLGKRMHEYSLIEDQKYVLDEIVRIVSDESADGVLIAGDIYDKSVPSAEAVELLDDFLYALTVKGVKVFAAYGNHDSPERVAFGSRLMGASGIFVSPVYDGNVRPITVTDGFGNLNVYMLPFVKPSVVRRFFEGEEISTFTDAVRAAVKRMNIDVSERNVLIAHQFVSGAKRYDSEEVSIGGADDVDVRVFDGFDYVALGHLHGPQNCDSPRVRYCGTPLKYSFSEADDQKSVTVVTINEKGAMPEIKTVPLKPLHDVRELRGKYDELSGLKFYDGTTYTTDFVRITLTDEDDVYDAVGRLRSIYKNLLRLDYDNSRTSSQADYGAAACVDEKTPLELFAELFEKMNGKPMTDEQSETVRDMIEKIWDDGKRGESL